MAFKFDVVISGVSGRFPECDDIDTFKRKLYTGNSNEFITSTEKKWSRGFKLNRYRDKVAVPDAIGKYTEEINFDYRLFKFSQLFGRSTDILTRKVLEPSFEAIVDAGINPYSLDGANIGVFMTGGISEREIYCVANIKNCVFVLGNARTMAPNRLSYALNFRGPSYAIHTDPLGGFEALKVARDQISDGSIEAAVVAVASNVSDPKFSYLYMYLDLLTHEDFCRSFDKNASGFVRSESAVVFFLQREQDAKRHYAKLLLCDSVFEGLSSHSLLGYNEEYLRKSLDKIYERNADNVLPEDIAFVELTGCAVKKFESSETNAVADVLCKQRTKPLMIGSAMSSVGHTEAASGFLSILKTLLVLDSQIIPPNSNLSEMNDDIRAFREKQLQVVTKKTELCGNMAAVNTVGLWGALNHAVFQNNVKKKKPKLDKIPRLLLLSGRTMDGLRHVLRKIEFDFFNPEVIALTNEVFQKNMPFHIYRGFTILPKTERAVAVLDESGHSQRPICFIFSGMGSQWNGMGQQLLDFPVIAEVIKRCDAVLKPKSIDIYKVLLSDDPTIFDDITMSFVAIICMQIALVEVLKTINIVPDLIVGHSVGENGCAYVDGCLTLEQAVLGSYNRGIASTSIKTTKGMMAAIGKGYEEIRHEIPENIEIACHNSANSCTLSGPAEDIDAYVGKLKNQGVFAKSVNVANIAYHSKYIAPAAPKLLELLTKVIPKPKKRSSKWISSSVPESEWHLPIADRCSAEYLTNNLLKPVLFEEACKHIPKDAICIEIAPHGLLQAILKRSLPETCTNISLTLRSEEKNNLNFLLSSIGRLYVAGCEPVVNNLYPSIEYPVSRGTPSIASYCTWFHGDTDVVTPPYKSAQPIPLSKENIVVRINEDAEFNFLKYHQINGNAVIPPAFFLYLVWRMLAVHQNVKMDEFPVLFEKIQFHKDVKILISKPRLVNIMIQASGFFEVLCRAKTSKKESKVILTGRVEFLQFENLKVPSVDPVKSKFLLNAEEINAILKSTGFLLGECFQLLTGMNIEKSEFEGNIEWKGNWVTFLDSIMKFQMFSDLKESKLCFLKSVRRMVLIPAALNSQKSGSLVAAKYCKTTKYFHCKGIEIYDARWKRDNRSKLSKLPSTLKVRQMRFVSYSNPACQSHDEFFDLCWQISLDSMEIKDKIDSKFYVCDYTGNFMKIIRQSEKIIDSCREKIIFCDDKTPPLEILSYNDILLFVAAEKIPVVNVSHLKEVYILLVISNNNLKFTSTEFSTILKQNFDGKMFILLKKKLNNAPAIRVAKSNTLSRGSSNGMNHVENEIVIRPNLDATSLTLMFSKAKCHSTRYIFMNGDDKACIENEPTFKSRLTAGLPKIIMKNQDWGSYRYRSSDSINSNNDNSMLENSLMDVRIQSIRLQFIRPDLAAPGSQSNEDLGTSEQSIGIEFSGVDTSGQKLMGITKVNLNEQISKLDPLLTWKVPDEWTLAEAASVPLIYAHVFHIPKLIERSPFMPSPTVLINAGEDMLIVEICVSMCISRGYTVYVVVSGTEQVNRLRHSCPWLNESGIILSNDGLFDCYLLSKMKGERINVVINYSSDMKNFTSTMNCLSYFAYYIDTVQSDMNENYEMGMRPFAHNLTFIAFRRSTFSLLNMRDDDKKILFDAVNKGIQTGLIRPVKELTLKKPLIKIDDDRDALNGNKSSIKTFNSDGKCPEKFGFRHRHSHIIFGGECSEESWIKLIYWLKGKGGTNFVVLVEKFPTKQRMSQLLNRLLADKTIIISFKPLKQLMSVKDATQLLQETSKLAPIDSVFFVSLDSSSQKIHFMDTASQQVENKIKFFSIFSGGLKEMELRRSKGLPAYVLHGENFPKDVTEVMMEFEKTLSNCNWTNGEDILYQIIEKRHLSNPEDTLDSLRNYLPKTVDCLEEIGRRLSETVEFVEFTSKCLTLSHCRGVLPVFVVPGLHASTIQSLLHSLMYPVFCASLSENCFSVSNTAAKLFEHLKKIQPVGPVTLIGETWNGTVAVELSSMIKQCGRDFRLFLLQGNPVEWKETIKSFNLTDHHNFENTLIQIYGEKLKKCLTSKQANTDGDGLTQTNNAVLVRRCLNVLKCQFKNVRDYNADNAKLENSVIFSETIRQNITSSVSNTCDIICIKEDKYENFIRSPVIKKKINKEAMFSWNI